jgi:opacity protein-like surface antigen
MRVHWWIPACLAACSAVACAQTFEASVSGGQTLIPSKNAAIGSDTAGNQYVIQDGISIGLRMTINPSRFFGHEFGYIYNHTSLTVPAATTVGTGVGLPGQPGSTTTTTTPAQSIGIPAHQGFYDFLVYAAPEGFRVRPFAAGGVQFTAFSQPGQQGNRETKYGINYGGGIKIKVKEPWGMRLDVRQYNMGKPFNLPNASGRLIMWQFSGGIAFML